MQPQSITLKVWLERWVDGMEQDELCVAVFPTPDQEGMVLDPADVADAIAQKAGQARLIAPACRCNPGCRKTHYVRGLFVVAQLGGANPLHFC